MAFELSLDGQGHEIEIVRRRPRLIVRIDGREHEISAAGAPGSGRQTIEISGAPVHFTRAEAGDRQIVRLNGRTFEIGIVDPRSQAEGPGGGHDHVKAPMPGCVVDVHKQPGDEVVRGDAIVTIESMKLQMALLAPRDGRIARLLCEIGDTFEKDAIIAQLEAANDGN